MSFTVEHNSPFVRSTKKIQTPGERLIERAIAASVEQKITSFYGRDAEKGRKALKLKAQRAVNRAKCYMRKAEACGGLW